jgi:hypothetical protein
VGWSEVCGVWSWALGGLPVSLVLPGKAQMIGLAIQLARERGKSVSKTIAALLAMLRIAQIAGLAADGGDPLYPIKKLAGRVGRRAAIHPPKTSRTLEGEICEDRR